MLVGFSFESVVREFVNSLEGIARRDSGKYTETVSMDVSSLPSRDVLGCAKVQLSVSHPSCCTNSIQHKAQMKRGPEDFFA